MRWPGFVGPAYRAQSPFADVEQLVNWWVARIDAKNATVPFALFPTPGFVDDLVLTQAPVRGLFANKGRSWVVADMGLSEFFADGAVTPRGNVQRDNNLVTMTTNGDGGDQLFVTSGGRKYILDLNAPHTLTDLGPGVISGGPVIMGDMLDGFFIALEVDGFSISDAFDGLTWDPLQFRQRSSAPDPWKAMKVVKDRIYLLGDYTTDLWANAGEADVPFAPIQGAQIREGIAAPFSATEFEGTLAWLAQNRHGDRTVQQATGYTAQRISDHGVELALARYARVDDAESFTFEEQGVEHLIINFPSADASWGYTREGGWYQPSFYNVALARDQVWRPRCHAFTYGKHLYGDRNGATIFRGSMDLGLDAGGGPIRRVRVPPLLDAEHARVQVDVLELVAENGIGLVQGQGSNPTVVLQKSKTAGRTWGPERWKAAGRQGEYQTRIRWRMLGNARNMGIRIVVTDPIPWRLTDMLINPREAA